MDQPKKEESIFEVSNFELKKYQRHVSNARTVLFVIAGLKTFAAIILSFIRPVEELIDMWIEVLLVGGTFLVLAMIAEKKPYGALISALIIYMLSIVFLFVLNPDTIFRGLIFKIIIITYLIKGIVNAGEIKDIKKMTGG